MSRTARGIIAGAAAVLVLIASLVGFESGASASGSFETTTTVNDVVMRACPHIKTCKQTGFLTISGSVVYVYCYTTGDDVHGDKIWYDGATGSVPNSRPSTLSIGYVAGYYLQTGHDPHPGIAKC